VGGVVRRAREVTTEHDPFPRIFWVIVLPLCPACAVLAIGHAIVNL
jgi:hypothetical protein